MGTDAKSEGISSLLPYAQPRTQSYDNALAAALTDVSNHHASWIVTVCGDRKSGGLPSGTGRVPPERFAPCDNTTPVVAPWVE